MKIKYDLRTLKLTKIVAIVSSVMFLIGLALLFWDSVMEQFGNGLLGLWLLFFEGAGLVMILCWGSYWAGRCYMKRLKSYGYELPINKKDYNNNLRNLPIVAEPEGVSLGSKYSRAFMIVALALYVIFLGLDIYYYAKWNFMGENSLGLFIVIMILHLFWVFFALALRKQSNKEKYRDDVEKDYSRKTRWSMEGLIVAVVIMAFISLYANICAHTMTEYIYKSQQLNEQMYE